MATYNGEKYIIEQLDSIRKQTKQPDEVIICDDCSLDNTCLLIKQYIENNSLKGWNLFKNDKNTGFYFNFFKALEKCSGDIIFLSDQDDVWDKHKIETICGFYDKNPKATMVQSSMFFIDGDGKKIDKDICYHGKNLRSGFVELTDDDMCKFAGSGYTMSFRQSVKNCVLDNALQAYYSTFLFHDILLGLVATATGQCYLCADVKDAHRLHNGNATQSYRQSYISDRTKEKQLTILARRMDEFKYVMPFCINSKKRNCFEKFQRFAENRKKLVGSRKFGMIKAIMDSRECYSTKFGIITDILYALNCEKLLCFIYRKI